MNPFAIQFPCGHTRRQFLGQAGCGFFGTAMAWMLAQEGFTPHSRSDVTQWRMAEDDLDTR